MSGQFDSFIPQILLLRQSVCENWTVHKVYMLSFRIYSHYLDHVVRILDRVGCIWYMQAQPAKLHTLPQKMFGPFADFSK